MSVAVTIDQRGSGISVDCCVQSREEADWLISALSHARDFAFPKAELRDIYFVKCGGQKINAIREVRTATGMGLQEAKEFVEDGPHPSILMRSVLLDSAQRIFNNFANVGSVVELREAA